MSYDIVLLFRAFLKSQNIIKHEEKKNLVSTKIKSIDLAFDNVKLKNGVKN